PATFKVTVHEIKTKQLPELDDEFAKDADEEVETLDALKEKIKTRLEESKKHEAEHHVRDTVVEAAAANAEMEIPAAMVDTEVNRMMQEFEQRLQMQGMNLELYFQFSGQDEAALREQMKEEAEKRVRVNLTLEAIAKAENIEVSDEEVSEELNKMAEMYNMSADQITQALGSLEGLKADLQIKKAVDFLVENSKTVA
ncbi:trigger factor, partial [Diaphorobacter sp. DS2]